MPVVTGIHSILAINEDPALTWSNPAPRQTPVIVTYSFSSGKTLNKFGEGFPKEATYHEFSSAQQSNFRQAADKISDVSGVVFVEVEGRGMINVARGEGTKSGGFANYPVSGPDFTAPFFGELVIDGRNSFAPGTYEFQTLLHEIGHAVGLEHPHEGKFTLRDDLDNVDNTIMTYNVGNLTTFQPKLGRLDKIALKHLYGDKVNTKGWKFDQDGREMEITGSDRKDTIFGVATFGGKAKDRGNDIKGKGGNDVLIGREDGDIINGGDGKDKIWGLFGHDDLIGGSRNDNLYGGNGDDKISGGNGSDNMAGGKQNDVLRGGNQDDKAYGGNGDDDLYGGGGRDRLEGGANADLIYGGAGDDRIFGGQGDDDIYGGKGRDVIEVDDGFDFIATGSGADTIVFDNNSGSKTVLVDFNPNADTIDLTALNTNFAALNVDQLNDGVLITAPGGLEIKLRGVNESAIGANDFDF